MRLFLVLIVFCCATIIRAQETSVFATNPASLKWYQINSPHFRVLYPKGFEEQAQRMANTLETIREPEARSMNGLWKRVTLVLQNQTTVSNGFVSMMPKRSEFYTMPSQNYNFVGNNDWLNMLATHEYRHVAQFRHARRGLNKILFYGLGYNALAGMASAAAPQWFWEGDAVATETAFTSSGRGRIPNFDLVFRTNLQEGRTFNYHKQYLESYKNNISNWYVLGYHMVSYLRKRTGDPMIWDKVTARAWNLPIIPFRFSSALKKETGLFVTDLYKQMASDLKKEWKEQQDTLRLTPFENITARTNQAYTDYLYPQELEDGSVVARKVGIGDIEQLVAIGKGETKTIFTQGFINESGMQSSAQNRVVWNEFRFDPRWQMRTYSTLVGYDFKSKHRQVITHSQRYAGAALSPDASQIATVETSTDYQTRLLLIDYNTGQVKMTFENPDNNFISMPHWAKNGTEIVALLTNKNGKAIVKFDVASGVMTRLTDFSNENIGYPVPFEKYVLYNSPVSGIDNIYALDVNSGECFQITSSKYGAYNACVSHDGKTIYYNNQSRNGMDVVSVPFDPASWKPWKKHEQPKNNFGHLVEQEGMPSLLSQIPQHKFEYKRFHRWKGIINPYSWGPSVGTSLTNTQVPIGITSQDILSTTQLFAGLVYDRAENNWIKKASVSFQGWYPVIDFSVTESDRKVNEGDVVTSIVNLNDSTVSYLQPKNLTFKWKEKNIEGGLRLPLVTTASKFIGQVTIGNTVGFTQVSGFQNSFNNSRYIPAEIQIKGNDTTTYVYPFINYQGNGNLIYNHFSISAYRLLKKSKRDIYSKWGQSFFMDSYGTPYGGNYNGAQFTFYGILYFPGLFKHHSLWGYWGYQYSRLVPIASDINNYTFRNQLPLPRGLGITRFQNMYTMSANYTMPVWYPDIALGPLLNIQRVRANGFFDYGFGSGRYGNRVSQTYMSTGIEVKFDINVMRLLPQLDIGFRYSRGLNPSASQFEFLLGSINF
ncbi:MAG: hypothetical protein JST48_02350 [Bacteroidetes bacterium]|nr:hypothetical protein [Bacteroidota bacterium]